MAEQRELKRRHLIYYLDVYEQGMGDRLGSLGDLTAKGLLLLAEQPCVPGSVLSLEIDLPETGGFHGGCFAVDAKVMWSDTDGSPLYHCVGLEFENLGATEAAIVRSLIKLVGFED